MTILTRQEKERLVFDLYNQGKTYREISKEARISPRDIGVILNKVMEEKKTEREEGIKQQDDEKNWEQEQQLPSLSTQAYKLFSEGKAPLEVAIALNLSESEATKFCKEYWKLKQLHKLNSLYEEIGDDLTYFLKLCKLAKKEDINVESVVKILQLVDENNASGLSHIEKGRKWRIDEIHELDLQIARSKNHLHSVNDQITSSQELLNSYDVSCERKRQEAVTLNNEISRLDTLVSLCKSNNEGYSKLKQIVKENVKSFLAENKQIISVSFTALIQTLKAEPEIVNVIHNIHTANDGEQRKDNNNITKYLESNKDKILDLAEKNYENLIEALTNNAISSAAAATSSTDPTSSLLSQSSSTLPNLSNQEDIHSIEDPERFRNSKGKD